MLDEWARLNLKSKTFKLSVMKEFPTSSLWNWLQNHISGGNQVSEGGPKSTHISLVLAVGGVQKWVTVSYILSDLVEQQMYS